MVAAVMMAAVMVVSAMVRMIAVPTLVGVIVMRLCFDVFHTSYLPSYEREPNRYPAHFCYNVNSNAYDQLEWSIMNIDMQSDICDETCLGTGADIQSKKDRMIDESVAAQMADVFKALADPTRVKLIYALLNNELCVHDLSTLLEMGQSAVSHQLRYLRNLRIVKRRKSGKTVFYSLDDKHIEEIFVQTLQHLRHH